MNNFTMLPAVALIWLQMLPSTLLMGEGRAEFQTVPLAASDCPEENSAEEKQNEASKGFQFEPIHDTLFKNSFTVPQLAKLPFSIQTPNKAISDLYASVGVILKGIHIVGSKREMVRKSMTKEMCDFSVSGDALTGFEKGLYKKLNKTFIGKPFNQDKVDRVKEVIYSFYKAHGHPFVDIVIPPQDISNGCLQVIVIESRLGQVEVEGNRHDPTKRVQNSISVKPGDTINMNRVSRDVNFLNRNTFQHIDAIYSPGAEPATTDITLSVVDRFPLRVYAGADNTGVHSTGRNRVFAGFVTSLGWSNILTYQYTANPENLKYFQAHTAQFRAFLPWKHELKIFGGYSQVEPKRNTHFVHKRFGHSEQGSLRYIAPLIPRGMLNQEVSGGFDFKRTNNTVEFTEVFPRFSHDVNLFQLTGGYLADCEGDSWRVLADLELFYSPGSWLPDQSERDYSRLRPGAEHTYVYGKAALRYLQRVPRGFSILLWGRGQLSSEPLLPSEQFGIGGWDTVRGYEERQLNADNAFVLNVELRTPSYKVFTKTHARNKDGLQFLLFLDYGYGRNKSTIAKEPRGEFLLGAGPGARYTFDPFLTARYDWGFKWHSSPHFGGGGSMHYFSVILNL